MNSETTKKSKTCFVCEDIITDENINYNSEVNLPVCSKCVGTEKEKQSVKEAIESLGDGFVCGCI